MRFRFFWSDILNFSEDSIGETTAEEKFRISDQKNRNIEGNFIGIGSNADEPSFQVVSIQDEKFNDILADNAKVIKCYPNPSAAPKVCGTADFFFTAAFIYWHARQDNLEYAETSSVRPLVNSVSVSKGERKDVNFRFEPGFKIGFGGIFQYDGWDLYGNYTWLNPGSHRSSTSNDQHTLRTRWVIPTVLDADAKELPLQRAKAKWRMRFNVLDLELGRNFFVGQKVTMRPYLGFKLAFIDQDYKLDYHLDTDILNFGNQIEIDMDQDYIGFGIRTGVNGCWMVSKYWSIFGDIAVSILWSRFEDARKDTTKGTLLGDLVTYNTEHEFNTLKPVLESTIGIRYTKEYDNWQFYVQAGWEEQVWFSHNQFPSPHSDHEGNLVLHGLTAQFGFFF
ncbi:MAG: Lpg1974 family pore-forming outer membrane protein [Chlamydiae bacterium]|nr:Lpg1974 family pore-forming outer membrane protein [Chlamydiota bacterium]